MKIALISCSSKKKTFKCKAKEMYSESILFRLTLQYCKQENFDKIFILSAKYGIIELDDNIEPYDITLNKMSKSERDEWGAKITKWININLDIYDEIYIFAGKNYYKHLHIYNKINLPFRNLPIGKRLQWLKERIKNENVERKSEVNV